MTDTHTLNIEEQTDFKGPKDQGFGSFCRDFSGIDGKNACLNMRVLKSDEKDLKNVLSHERVFGILFVSLTHFSHKANHLNKLFLLSYELLIFF